MSQNEVRLDSSPKWLVRIYYVRDTGNDHVNNLRKETSSEKNNTAAISIKEFQAPEQTQAEALQSNI